MEEIAELPKHRQWIPSTVGQKVLVASRRWQRLSSQTSRYMWIQLLIAPYLHKSSPRRCESGKYRAGFRDISQRRVSERLPRTQRVATWYGHYKSLADVAGAFTVWRPLCRAGETYWEIGSWQDYYTSICQQSRTHKETANLSFPHSFKQPVFSLSKWGRWLQHPRHRHFCCFMSLYVVCTSQ